MQDIQKQFETYLVDIKKVSANTLQSYLRDISQYLSYLDAKNLDPFAVNSDQLKKYISHLNGIGLSQSTVTRSAASVRCFYRFAILNGFCDENPAMAVHAPKAEKKSPEIMTAKEIERLLAQPDVADLKGCRDKAMLELLYATGIRVSELISLNVEDVNLELGILYCRNDKKERMIPIYDEAAEAVADYLKRVRNAVILDYRETALFTNMSGSRMTRQGFWKLIKSYTKTAGIKKDITPHTLRHSFAAHLLENGAQLKDIKEMMGHADISSTQVYARMIKERYKNVYANCHPKARRA